MSEESAVTTFAADLKQELRELKRSVTDGAEQLFMTVRNEFRHWQKSKLDYVILPIGGPLPERADPPRSYLQRQLPFPAPPLSMETVNYTLQNIADAANVKGILFIFRGFSTGLATLQNLRRSIQRFQESGKQVVVYTPFLDLAHYYTAVAADRIIVPPGAQFNVLGLRTEALFLKDAFASIGIGVDVVQTSGYKTGADMFSQAEMTAENRAQLEWLLDDQFDMLTADFSAGRHKSQDEIKAIINQAPYSAEKACELGLVDEIAHEDELPQLLSQPALEEETAEDQRPQAKLLTYGKARPILLEKFRRRTTKFIGVISIEGTILIGSSRQAPGIPIPFVDSMTAGSDTVLRQLRRAERMNELAALILHVDSPGGSALASELLTRDIERLGRKIPIVTYMGNIAASGGYQVSSPTQKIMCQTGTITGSIGVFLMRPHTQGLFRKLNINRVSLKRGERAGLYSDEAPLTPEEEAVLRQSVEETYRSFKELVANGRNLPYDDLDPICEGRVWSGRQALSHKLIDAHGDFVDAVRLAAELANLPTEDDHEIPVVNIYPSGQRYLSPKPFDLSEPQTSIAAEIWRLFSGESIAKISGQPLTLMPFKITFR